MGPIFNVQAVEEESETSVNNCQSTLCKGKVHLCTGTEALYRPYGTIGGVEV